MKLLLGLAAALALASAAYGQTDQIRSDQYVCNHGQPSAPATAEACARLRNGEGAAGPTAAPADEPSGSGQQPATTPALAPSSTPPPAPSPPPTTSPPQAPAAAAPSPTDVGEAPVNDLGANEAVTANADQDASGDASGHGGWFAGFGALAIIFIAICSFAGLAIYFIPSMIAISRHKRNALAIFALNLFLGWSMIGWVAALIWSLTAESII